MSSSLGSTDLQSRIRQGSVWRRQLCGHIEEVGQQRPVWRRAGDSGRPQSAACVGRRRQRSHGRQRHLQPKNSV